jgi:hypothetical protein
MATGSGQGSIAFSSDLTPTRSMSKYVAWIKTEFQPLTLATPDATIEQCVDTAVRYWNTHSAYKIITMVDTTGQTSRVQLNSQFKGVMEVLPCQKTTSPISSMVFSTSALLLGVTVIDNVTSDLILLSEGFRNYRSFIGADFTWEFTKSEDPAVGGYLYYSNLPALGSQLAVVGTKRITADEDIKQDYILDWLLRYVKALVQMIEGNTLRKSSIIDIKNDGQALVDEGKDTQKALQEELVVNGRWCAFARRG